MFRIKREPTILIHDTTWMKLKNIILSEIVHTQRSTYDSIAQKQAYLMCILHKSYLNLLYITIYHMLHVIYIRYSITYTVI